MGLRQSIGIRRPALLLAALFVLTLVCAPRAEAFVYWANNSGDTLGRATIDGTDVNQSFITGAENPWGVAVDAEHVYWTAANGIGRANLDGTDVDQSFIAGEGGFGVAVDSDHVYWTGQGTIGRANLDGTDVDPDFIAGANPPFGLAVDGAHIYWSRGTEDAIGRANLDGTDVDQNFITLPPESDRFGESAPQGVAVDCEHVYWANFTAASIGRADLDGTGVNNAFIPGATVSDSPWGVAVDGEHIYWTHTGPNTLGQTIARANLDGTEINETFITGASFAAGVAVDRPPPSNDFGFGTLKKNKDRGTAKLAVDMPCPGKLDLAKTKRVKRAEVEAESSGEEVLRIRSRRKARRHLNAKGKARVKAWVTYTPHGGEPNTQSKRLKLIKRR